MSDHPHLGKKRAYLRRAVAPNLFTSTLHPEFIPALVTANLMTPCLWEWAERIMAEVKMPGPVEALHAIHQFLNKRFYHATGKEFAAVWGLQERRHLHDEEELAASDYAMDLIARVCDAGTARPTTMAMAPLLSDGLYPLYVHNTADVLRVQGRTVNKRTLGVTSCLDECVLAASLAVASGACRWEDMAFLGSPFHYTVFFFTSGGPVWFNAKREVFSQSSWIELCTGKDEAGRAQHLVEKLIIGDRLICGDGLAVFPRGHLAGDRRAVARAVLEVEHFAMAKLDWLGPIPESGEEHIFHGWEVVSSGLAGKAEGVQKAVLERAIKNDAPMLEAALYMYRHPEFCHPEVLFEAAQKNFYTFLKAASAETVEEVHALVEAVPGRESFFGPGGRIALPDEVLAFGTASEAERELLRRTMREHVLSR